jgi:spore maturation protein CgeB
MADDYGIPSRGHGHEYYNLLPAFGRLPLEVRQFDFAREIIDRGYWKAMEALREVVVGWQPDALFLATYQEQIDRDLMRWITAETPTTTIGWFSDDHWRFESYSRFWAPAFNWVTTTDYEAVQKYHAIGQPNVVLSQWAANEELYRPPSDGRLTYDVTFVGQKYGSRGALVDYLESHGAAVEAWGPGWPNGKASQEQMIEIFGRSKINLNFAAASTRGPGSGTPAQIKGRVFEVPACGGLLLTDYAPGLERYYEIGSEVEVFGSKRDLLDKVRSLLGDEERRARVARAGYERTLREHTWVERLGELLVKAGVLAPGSHSEGVGT